jgi:hypothetical protein
LGRRLFAAAFLGCGGVASIRRTVASKRTLGWARSLVLGEGLGMYGQIPLDKLKSLYRPIGVIVIAWSMIDVATANVVGGQV